MRLFLTLVTVLLISFKAIATVERNPGLKIHTLSLEKTILPLDLKISKPSSAAQIKTVILHKTAILYKMKENIIRRELSFTPKKKWMKWV